MMLVTVIVLGVLVTLGFFLALGFMARGPIPHLDDELGGSGQQQFIVQPKNDGSENAMLENFTHREDESGPPTCRHDQAFQNERRPRMT